MNCWRASRWPAPAALAYGAGFLLAVDASLGVNGTAYPAMFKLLLPFRGLRAPNRFAVLVGVSLSVLAGFGVARMLRRVRSPAGRTAIAALDRRPNVRLIAAEPWNGVESRLYDLSPARAPH